MIEAVISFIVQYKAIILFYLCIILFLIIKRKSIVRQAKIILLYRMKLGLGWMDKYAAKYRAWVVLLGYIGVGAGFVGLVLISYLLIKNLFTILTTPTAPAGVSLVLPGVNVPGLGILPFWYWLIAIFVIAVVHEFSHGIVARAHNIPVKHTGLAFFGPIIGAFVEPDEKKLRAEKDITQYSVYAAGAFSNVILALLALLLLAGIFTPIQERMIEPTGFTFASYFGGNLPAAQANLLPETLITGIEGKPTKNFQEFNAELQCARPGETVTLLTPDKPYKLVLAESPDAPGKPFLGISNIRNEFDVKEPYQKGWGKALYGVINWTTGFLRWLFVLSLGIGLFNLLPLPIVDGGRMAQVFLHNLRGKEKGERQYRKISLFFLLLLLLNLFVPLVVRLF
ncbi:MAG: site-2 protease family protein [Nanoarchaeota archaeon]|nr:site-2 protease family protein [Nanoarchaeota archaeon]